MSIGSSESKSAVESDLQSLGQRHERFRFVDDSEKPLVLGLAQPLQGMLTGAVQTISPEQASLLDSCRTFATIDEHVANLSARFGAQRAAEIEQSLMQFANAGLLVPYSGAIAALLAGGAAGATDKIKYVCLPTRNRAPHLKRCLESFTECFQRYGREVEYVVADQSTPEHIEANVQVLQDIKRRFGVNIRHIDESDAKTLIDEIADVADVPKSLVEFAVGNDNRFVCTAGANRNLLLLSAVGEMCLQVDDDMVCRLSASPGAEPGLRFAPIAPALQYWFLDENEPVDSRSPYVDEEPLALFEQVLGKTPSDCLRNATDPLTADIDKIGAEFFRMSQRPESRVVLSSLGVMGESGKSFWHAFLFLDGTRRSRIIQSEKLYRHTQLNHQILTAVPRTMISDDPMVRGSNMGMDNRQMLPPFMPVMRGQDSLLGRTISSTMNASFATMPWMLEHIGAGHKDRTSAGRINRAVKFSFLDIVWVLMSRSTSRLASSDSKSLSTLGSALMEYGCMNLGELNELLRIQLWNKTARSIKEMEGSLTKYGRQPKFWSDDVEASISAHLQNLGDKNFAVAQDIIENVGEADAALVQQQLIYKFGQLLLAWSEIRRGASELKKRHGGLGKTI